MSHRTRKRPARSGAYITGTVDVVLDNGDGTVTGPFDYDAMTNTFTNVNVTAVGAAFPASSASLTSILPDFSGAVTIDFVPSLADITGAQDVYISLASPMTGTRETIGVSDVYMYMPEQRLLRL